MPVHHQYAMLPLSTNMKTTSAPARGRCCKSYWLSGVKSTVFYHPLNAYRNGLAGNEERYCGSSNPVR
ncbi:MAG: hypothetical protein QGH12_07285 [SAR324 cluster bacterium]|nr:hypothetical protein [SAR324 cluster bacterium]